jgi:hypothetical protein
MVLSYLFQNLFDNDSPNVASIFESEAMHLT